MIIIFLFFGAVFAQQTTSRPLGVPDGLPCSDKTLGSSIRFGIGNAVNPTLDYFRLNSDCQQEPVGSIASGRTNFENGFIGESFYARELNGRVVDIFIVNGDTWVIQDKGFPLVTASPSTSSPTNDSTESTSSESTTDENNQSAVPVGYIVGIVVALLVIAFAVAGLLFYRKRKSSVQDVEQVQASKDNFQDTLITGHCYSVVKAHKSALSDELSVIPGDKVLIHAIYDDGWIHASLNCLEEIAERRNSKSSTESIAQFKNRKMGLKGMIPGVCLKAEK